MTKYVKIGADIINIEAISRITFVDNQSGISDRIIIDVSGSEVIVDSDIGGRERMEAVRKRLLNVLKPEDWEALEAADRSAKAA